LSGRWIPRWLTILTRAWPNSVSPARNDLIRARNANILTARCY
jgi:hypothetical protein